MTEIQDLAGHRFPGGTALVERWEQVLFQHATGLEEIPRHDRVHEAAAFHVPIRGAGTTISELFALVQAEGAVGIGIDHYDFSYEAPWRADQPLSAEGEVESVESVTLDRFGMQIPADRVTFTFRLRDSDELVVRSTIAWLVFRSSRSIDPDVPLLGNPEPERTGPPSTTHAISDVSPERMRLAAALLRDPYPIHWDPEATAAVGLGDRVVNQTPLNVAYVVNMLHDWRGPESIARLRLSFPGVVFGGDDLVATATETEGSDGRVAVQLRRDDEVVLFGTAWLRGAR